MRRDYESCFSFFQGVGMADVNYSPEFQITVAGSLQGRRYSVPASARVSASKRRGSVNLPVIAAAAAANGEAR